MRRLGSSPFAFPGFSGATRQLVLVNLCAFFLLLLFGLVSPDSANSFAALLAYQPGAFLHGLIWQPLTYSLVHTGITNTLFEMLSLWFLAGFLESYHNANWIRSLYIVSVLGTVAAALVIYLVSGTLHFSLAAIPIYGCFGGIFGLLTAIGVLYGDTEFLLMFIIGIKARYLAIIYGLVAIAMLFGPQKQYAFAQLGGAAAGLIFVRRAPRRGLGFALSEWWFGLRNNYYRRKRRKAAKKFEVYMKQHGRTVHFDGQGRVIHDEHDDPKRWN